ncbi:hypothetical protein [Nocardia wallacei]|uniref:hypothetical protein n=1 Tax=Nocardia wallacei TaxID=480035 RepID=UPI0024538A47|nr:hypothetical protein [Nocardia wallacei]
MRRPVGRFGRPRPHRASGDGTIPMAIENKITHQLQAAKANLDRLFGTAAGDGSRRTESLGHRARGAIDRARQAFKR